jgi:hypothetical protein
MRFKRFIPPALVVVLSAFLGWLSGYDFDKRNTEVCMWAGFTAALAWLAYMAPDIDNTNDDNHPF